MRQVSWWLALASCTPHAALAPPEVAEPARWEARAARVTITRDTWGIAHVRGPTDADAVFAMMYAQAEDDFARVERNYLVALGMLAQAEGESAVYQDLRARLFVDPADLRARYASAPEWLRALLDAWADGLNFYLHAHPEVRPRVLTRFEPWMALAFSEGSIGGDIERISLADLEAFYASAAAPDGRLLPPAPGGSNGVAIAAANTVSGRALLLINPHTSFFFRDELQVTSDEGLNVYGAVTWGQPFVYQGFNEQCGWMHTSSAVDSVDEFSEDVTRAPDGGLVYRYGQEQRPVRVGTVVIRVKTDAGFVDRPFATYHTHHGPIVREVDGRWVAVALMFDPVQALTESFGRTKATDLASFRQTLDQHANSSNNTVYADADGSIAYFHVNFVPRRDDRFDFARPVDGADPATDWRGVHPVDELPNSVDPPGGWVQNTNDWPYSAAGAASPLRERFPSYMDRGTENARGLHAMALLDGRTDWTLDALVAAAYDPHLPTFDAMLPPLFAAYDALPRQAPLRKLLAEPIATLREWDRRWAADSVATTLAIAWGERIPPGDVTDEARLAALRDAVGHLTGVYGAWRVPWGDVNRFQRISPAIEPAFTDRGPSVPVPFTEARWGSLAVFQAQTYDGTRSRYGTAGNSFVAVVEFGERVRARAVTAGGVSGDPLSPHFADQLDRYARGDLREVWFYPDELAAHVEREYHPGDLR